MAYTVCVSASRRSYKSLIQVNTFNMGRYIYIYMHKIFWFLKNFPTSVSKQAWGTLGSGSTGILLV